MSTEPPQRPATINIRHLSWTLEDWPASDAEIAESFGVCLTEEQRIRIKEGMTPRLEAEIVLHECIHAMLFSHSLRSKDGMTEEDMAEWLPGALAQLFNDNEALGVWWNHHRRA